MSSDEWPYSTQMITRHFTVCFLFLVLSYVPVEGGTFSINTKWKVKYLRVNMDIRPQ